MIFIFALFIIVIGFGLLLLTFLMRRSTGVPVGNVVYSDSQRKPGEVLESTTIPLVGKPDYLIKKGKYFIPIEVKTGKTPRTPYANHVAQLNAYCLLVEENYGVRPPYGIIDYPEQDFELEFSEGTEENLKKVVSDLLDKKGKKIERKSLSHICRSCREQHLQE